MQEVFCTSHPCNLTGATRRGLAPGAKNSTNINIYPFPLILKLDFGLFGAKPASTALPFPAQRTASGISVSTLQTALGAQELSNALRQAPNLGALRNGPELSSRPHTHSGAQTYLELRRAIDISRIFMHNSAVPYIKIAWQPTITGYPT
jgi:hypothetical protein